MAFNRVEDYGSMYNISTDELTEASARAAQPDGVQVQLRAHQLALLHRCRQLEAGPISLAEFSQSAFHHDEGTVDTIIGIIGDMAGSGKSFVILSLINMHQPSFEMRRRPSTVTLAQSRIIVTYMPQAVNAGDHLVGNTLLVVPHSIATQWQRYVQAFSEDLAKRCLLLNKSKDMENIDVRLTFATNSLVIVTAPLYNRLVDKLMEKNITVHRLVFDEADSLNIPACSKLDASFTWFVTASYGNLLYPRGLEERDPSTRSTYLYATGLRNSGFIRNVFTELTSRRTWGPVFARAVIVRNSDRFIQTSITLPPIEERVVRCRNPSTVSLLYGYVENVIIDRLNAGDMEGAMQYVDRRDRDTEENIVAASIRKFQDVLARVLRRMESTNSLLAEEVDEHEREALQAEIERQRCQVTDLERRIQGIRERITQSDSCSICLDTICKKSVVKCCSVPLCFECIQRWIVLRHNCPFCKRHLSQSDVSVVVTPGSDDMDSPGGEVPQAPVGVCPRKDKIANLEALLRQSAPHDRFLVCSSFDGSFDRVAQLLRSMNIVFAQLKGNAAQVASIVRCYMAGSIKVLLVNTLHYGSGLDLSMTTDLVLFHRIESEIQKQVIGRAQRFGRLNSLRLWYLLHDNEVNDS